MAPTELILLRHGETAWNRERRIQGQLDTPLADEGVRQARAAARRLVAEGERWGLAPADGRSGPALVGSDLLRCRQTAEPIALALGLALVLEPRLRERRFGPYEGRTVPEIRAAEAERFDRWHRLDPDHELDGAETLRGFAARVESALRELAAAHAGRTLVLVTHGGVLDVVNRLCRGLPLEAPRDFEIPNAGINHVRYSGGRFELIRWGDAGHWRASLDEL
jgi:probable phosphoglycerate mutase